MNLTPHAEPRIVAVVKQCGLLAAIAWSLTGCTAAYNSRTVNSPDWRYATTVYIRGAMGRSYLADTKKKIVVSIFALSPDAQERIKREKQEASAKGVWTGPDNPGAVVTSTNTLLFRKEYRLRGSDLDWNPVWGDQDRLSITFYDYGAGVEIPYSSRDEAPKRVLRTLNYRFDSDLGTYREEAPKQ